MISQDNYQYQPKPLPQVPVIGADNYAPSQIARVDFDDIGGAKIDIPVNQSPYSNPDFTGGGGGAIPPPFTCDDGITVGTIQASVIAFPCVTPTSSVSEAGIALDTWLNISQGAVSGDSGTIELKELDVPHMGAPGKRQFVCGNAYEA